jgi:GntR family transcriptional regulator
VEAPIEEVSDMGVERPAHDGLDLAAAQPAYMQAQEAILAMVEGPDLAPGDKIPSERVLSEQFGISRMTLRRAVDNLVRLGVLERRSTSGTHVAAPNVVRPLDGRHTYSMSQIVQSSGGAPGSRLLFFEAAVASAKLAENLGVAAGAPLIAIRRLRTSNGVPFCVETSYLPAERVPGLAAADLLENASLYGILKERFGIQAGDRRGVISVAPIGARDASLLELEPEASALLYRSIVSDRQGKPIEHMISVNHPQRVMFQTNVDLLSSE